MKGSKLAFLMFDIIMSLCGCLKELDSIQFLMASLNEAAACMGAVLDLKFSVSQFSDDLSFNLTANGVKSSKWIPYNRHEFILALHSEGQSIMQDILNFIEAVMWEQLSADINSS